MLKKVKELYNDTVLNEALRRYGVDGSTIRNLGGNESFVYGFESEGQEYILKIIHSSHRSAELVKAELDWLNYLTGHGVRLSKAIPSRNQEHVETIEAEDSYFVAVVYEKAKGDMLDEKNYDPALIEKWGKIMGRMHALAKQFLPSESAPKRLEWHENAFMNAEKWLPPSEKIVKNKFNELYERLRVLPRGKDDYGLIHSDLHHRNFLVNEGEITVIDFDDLEYHWFINDIAKTLYNEAFTFSIQAEERHTFSRFFLRHFMSGYMRENHLDPSWMAHLQDFLKLRHMYIYIKLWQQHDHRQLDDHEKTFLAEYRDSIEQDIPLLDI
jgi:Ser/Thr protein kinase RdoA (MazF antagonist)